MSRASEEFITEFNQIYELKKQSEELIYKMNDFCSKWDGNLTVSEIPYLIKLFDDNCSTSEQNEFIVEAIRSIYEKSPLDTVRCILDNTSILSTENSEECFFWLCIFVIPTYNGYKEFLPDIISILAKYPGEVVKEYISYCEEQIEKEKNSIKKRKEKIKDYEKNIQEKPGQQKTYKRLIENEKEWIVFDSKLLYFYQNFLKQYRKFQFEL
ncbi:hypothetical protein [Tissierella praeacuta]|uniref:hypothetical protein n=1 Tax=Tissierella praeacuta TaxID=43131 RepID=UPI0033420590